MDDRRDIRGLYRLMEAYIDGDKRSFVRLHARLAPRLRGFLVTLVRDDAAADDLVQLALLKAHLARERFALQGGDPDGAVQGWYFAIARNVAMDFLRDKYRTQKRRVAGALQSDGATSERVSDRVSDLVSNLVDGSPTPEELGTRLESEREIIEDVRAAIARLPPGQREVVELHKLRGMSMAEVAERLQVREGAVRVRAHRAYKALARLLGPKALTTLLLMGPSDGPEEPPTTKNASSQEASP